MLLHTASLMLMLLYCLNKSRTLFIHAIYYAISREAHQ